MQETEERIELDGEELEELPHVEPETSEDKNPERKEQIKEEDQEISKAVVSLGEKIKQTLFDSLISSITNSGNRDTILYLTLTKAYKLLRENGKRSGTIESDSEFANRVFSLSSQERQILFDSVISSVQNQNSRDTVLHVLFWKAEKLLSHSEK
ncbi:hypothetical protein EHQ76_07245 [Leptospira barantonii]|uniref:Uncharacterized protein n=1 Tax=Leptospira barantonii TaxID=2023184 RepID=A0A5F2BH87_9LEPT|nr:hypothetical protein [Leptospira barantonii]TGM04832.1 hypothetical protein EHQ76_07245 [Leptospira barantonii]